MTVSAWSQEVWTDTLSGGGPPAPTGQIFWDDFERYAIGQELSSITPPVSILGGQWAAPKGDHPTIVSGGYGGDSKALGFHFRHRTDDVANDQQYAYSEQLYDIVNSQSKCIKEAWIECYVYWPSNYALRPPRNGGSWQHDKSMYIGNHKFGGNVSGMDPHSNGGNMHVNGEKWPYSNGTKTYWTGGAYCPFNDGDPRGNWGHAHGNYSSPMYHAYESGHRWDGANWFNPEGANTDSKAFWMASRDNGNWVQYRYHFRPTQTRGVANGLIEAWRDGTKIQQLDQNDWSVQNHPGFGDGYLFGWQGNSVVNACTVKLSRFSIYDADPGW